MLTPRDETYRELRLWGWLVFAVLAAATFLGYVSPPWYVLLAPLWAPPLLVIVLAYVGAFICYTADRMERIRA